MEFSPRWFVFVTDSLFVIQHTRCNVSFPNKQTLLLQVEVKPDEGQDPRTTPGLLETHNSAFVLGVPRLTEHALG